jgi:hypothetical protein
MAIIEVLVVFSILIIVFFYQINHIKKISYDRLTSDVPYEVVLVTRVWTVLLIISTLLAHNSDFTLSFPYIILVFALCLSGWFINNPVAQIIFHVASTTSWFGIYDLAVRSINNYPIDFFGWPFLTALFMTTSIVFRSNLGQSWQFQDPSLMCMGVVIMLGYLWGIELPLCTFLESQQSCCSFFQKQDPADVEVNTGILTFGQLSYDRCILLGSAVASHISFGQIMYFLIASSIVEEQVDGNCDISGVLSNMNSNQSISDSSGTRKKASSIGSQVRTDSTQKIDKNDIFFQGSDTRQQPSRSLPTDLKEITEEEALRIIQEGFASIKSKRAE